MGIEPILKVQKIEPFIELLEKIKKEIKDISKLEKYTEDIQILGQSIIDNKVKFEKNYKGQKNISHFLQQINDLMRIGKEFDIEPPYSEYKNIKDLPRIEVEFDYLKNNKNISEGRLTLIDTPGPDEANQAENLRRIFEEQLDRASAVTLVVDNTKVNSEEDVKIKEDVKKVTDILGKQHFFVLLNKFDGRSRGENDEKDKENAKQLVLKGILKESSIKEENIFPISSKQAFYSKLGLKELQQNQCINHNLSWKKEFGITILGERWERDIDNIKRVQEDCEYYWEKSFFEEALNIMIEKTYNNKDTLAIKIPLVCIRKNLKEISDGLSIHISTMDVSEAKLNKKIINIDNKIKNLKITIDKLKQQNINYSTKILNDEWKASLERIKRHFEAKKKELKSYKDELEFSSNEDAKSFSNELKNIIERELKNISSKSEKDFKKSIESYISKLNKDLKEGLGSDLEEIKKELGADIEILTPKISFINNRISMNGKYNIIEDGYRDERVKKDYFGSSVLRGIGSLFDADWGYEEYKIKFKVITKKSIIKIAQSEFDSLQKKINEDNTNNSKNVKEKIFKSINNNLTKKINSYKEEIEDIKNNQPTEEDKEQINLFDKLAKKIFFRINRIEKILEVKAKND